EPRVVDQDVDREAPLLELASDRGRRLRPREVVRQDRDRDAELLGEAARDRLEPLATARDEDEVVPVACEEGRELQSDSARCTRDEGGPARGLRHAGAVSPEPSTPGGTPRGRSPPSCA